MHTSKVVFKSVRPYLTALAIIAVTMLLVFTIYFTRFNLPWTAFLSGVLAAAVLSLISRTSRAEWIVARRDAKISSLQDRLMRELRLRNDLEHKLAQLESEKAALPIAVHVAQPVTKPKPIAVPEPMAQPEPIAVPVVEPEWAPEASAEQDMYVQSLSEVVGGSEDAINRILSAIEQDEFCLYCQKIVPLSADSSQGEHYEILIRLHEEEEGLMPPGAFFALVEQYGLMSRLDRWVVRHVIEWLALHPQFQQSAEKSIFFINIAADSIGDQEFADFVCEQLELHDVPPQLLCFEITENQLSLLRDDVTRFATKMRSNGSMIALCNFGRTGVLFEPLHDVRVDFLKIDGSLILDVARNHTHLAQATAITKVSKSIGVRTVAEMVETDASRKKLCEIGIDYGQGFGISVPLSLDGLHH